MHSTTLKTKWILKKNKNITYECDVFTNTMFFDDLGPTIVAIHMASTHSLPFFVYCSSNFKNTMEFSTVMNPNERAANSLQIKSYIHCKGLFFHGRMWF